MLSFLIQAKFQKEGFDNGDLRQEKLKLFQRLSIFLVMIRNVIRIRWTFA